jgi:hypothetical protein
VLLPIAGPVWPRLRIKPSRMLCVAMRHVLLGRIGRVLTMRVSGTRRSDGGIYRNIAVRFGTLLRILMVASILQRHGRRTCWCLRHTSSAAATLGASRMVCPLDMIRKVARPRRLRIDGVVRVGRRRCLVSTSPRVLLTVGVVRSR